MEMAGSLPVPSVQAMVAPPAMHQCHRGISVQRWPRMSSLLTTATTIPTIDFQRLLLLDPEESARLHAACQDWGFFQVIY
jgi:hypothetical protein